MKIRCNLVPLFSLMLLLLLNSSAAGGGGFALPGVGSKALSMGGAFRGLADDWSACFWNPAGVAYLRDLELLEINVDLYTYNFRPEYAPKVQFGQDDYIYRVGYQNMTYYPEDRALFLPSFSGFYKFTQIEGFSAGMAFFVPYKLQARWDVYDPPDEHGNVISYPQYDHRTSILVWDLHPTVAKDFMNGKFSLGAGLSIQRADFELKRVVLTPSIIYPRPYEYFPVDWDLETNGWGMGFNIGVLYKPIPKLQFGLSYRSPVDIDLEGDLDLEMYFPKVISDPWLDGTTYKYSNGEFKATLPLPGNLGIGAAFKPLDRLTLTFDVSSTSWSRLDYLKSEDLFFDTVLINDTLWHVLYPDESELLFKWDDITKLSLGGEYLFGENLRIRGGYFFEKSPIPNSTATLLIPDVGDKNSFNVGISYRSNSFEFGYNYGLVAHSKTEVTSIVDENQDGLFDNLPGDYKMILHSSCFSLTYRF
jgi:long-chain fatty acid transport protein